MKCYYCNSRLNLQNIFTYEDLGIDNEGTMVVLTCDNEKCNTTIEIYKEELDG